jgi:hypothetical protein
MFKPACKPRANYLKPKEIRKTGAGRRRRRFDLQQSLNYLKVKITVERAKPGPALRLQAGMIAS